MYHLQLFGNFSFTIGGELIKITSERAKAAIALLAWHQNGMSREELGVYLWPDADTETVKHNLRQLLYSIRRSLPEEQQDLIIDCQSGLCLARHSQIQIDLDEFRKRISNIKSHPHPDGRLCQRCIDDAANATDNSEAYYSDCRYYDGSFDEWLISVRADIELMRAVAYRALGEHYFVRGDFETSFETYLQLEKLELSGQELSKKISWLALLRGDLKDAQRRQTAENGWFSPKISSGAITNLTNMNFENRSFEGRVAELAKLNSLIFKTQKRVVSIVAGGGAGKTRLLKEFGTRILFERMIPVLYFDLSQLSIQNLPFLIGTSLGFKFSPDSDPKSQLGEQLGREHFCIILDSCENASEGLELSVTQLLATLPSLFILTGSRLPLSFEFDSYAMGMNSSNPNAAVTTPRQRPERALDNSHAFTEVDLGGLSQIEAARLMVNVLTTNANQDFISISNAPYIADICEKLQGIPLAVELAAGNAVIQGLPKVSKRIDLMIEGTSRKSKSELITSTLRWAFDSLSEMEQSFMMAAAVFANEGGIDDLTQFARELDVSETAIINLASRRFLNVKDDKFGIHELVKKFVNVETGEKKLRSLMLKHAMFCKNKLRAATQLLNSPDYSKGASKALAERANWNVALETLLKEEDRSATVAFIEDLSNFWVINGDVWHGKRLVELALTDAGNDAESVGLWMTLGNIENMMGLLPDSQLAYENARSLAIEFAQSEKLINIRRSLAIVYAKQNKYLEARKEFEALIVHAEQAGNKSLLANSTLNLGNVLFSSGEQDLDLLALLYTKSIDLMEELGEVMRMAVGLNNLGIVQRRQGKLEEAAKTYKRSIEIKEKVKDHFGLVSSLTNYGLILGQLEKYREAHLAFGKAIQDTINANTFLAVPGLLGNFSRVLFLEGDLSNAAKVFGISEKVYLEKGGKSSFDNSERDAWKNDLVSAMGKNETETKINEGLGMTIDLGYEFALKVANTSPYQKESG